MSSLKNSDALAKANPMSWKLSQFFAVTFSWINAQFFASDINVDRTIFPMFYFFNYNEVRNYWAIFQWHITPTENLNNFKRNLKIRGPSTEELGNLVKYKR